MIAVNPVDRRGPSRGDERRAEILHALEAILAEGANLDEINIADVSRRAGVTRSAFYFYFENKACAVAALADGFYADAAAATELLVDTDTAPAERIGASIHRIFDTLDRHALVYRAMLDARAHDPAVRELWERDRSSFVPAVAAMIEDERAAGRAAPGPDATTLASTLLDLNDRAMERRGRGEAPETDLHVEALTSIWLRSIYGSGGDA